MCNDVEPNQFIMKTRNILSLIAIAMTVIFIITGCKKEEEEEEQNTEKASVSMSISDAKSPYSTKSGESDITDHELLTKCEITISKIQLKSEDGSYVDILTNAVDVDLRQFQGQVKDLVNMEIPLGTYTAVKTFVSGVSTTYEGNNYTASVSGGASCTLTGIPTTFTEASGVVNAFSAGEISFEVPLSFTLTDIADMEDIRLFFDADASTYVVAYTYDTLTWNFAGIRPLPNVGIILEQGIQQIMHSPPMGITINGINDVEYYGIHTFIDFNGVGGTINSHTSQHVFRGADGTLLVDAEDMIDNTNPLTPNTVAATGESDIRADETFKYSDIVNYLATQGYTIESGNTYYFSLRKTWNITTDGQTYDLTRICEPIPVYIP
jgi:hypothetical protein